MEEEVQVQVRMEVWVGMQARTRHIISCGVQPIKVLFLALSFILKNCFTNSLSACSVPLLSHPVYRYPAAALSALYPISHFFSTGYCSTT
jgi:hypothetical protein